MSGKNKNGSGSLRVSVASASPVRRAGLESLIKSSSPLKLGGSFSSPERIFHSPPLQADVCLVDLDRSSLVLPARVPSATVILIDDPDPGWTAQALRAGVGAILERDASPAQIVGAINAAHSDLVLLSSSISQKLAERVRAPARQDGPVAEPLTARELEVLAMLAEGVSNREIADRLAVSEHTVKFHISSILDKLGVSTRTEAVTTGLRTGLILL
jgi:DNA-binding NarL/FixJ family response regulator